MYLNIINAHVKIIRKQEKTNMITFQHYMKTMKIMKIMKNGIQLLLKKIILKNKIIQETYTIK